VEVFLDALPSDRRERLLADLPEDTRARLLKPIPEALQERIHAEPEGQSPTNGT
jgi:Mg/Co/Ni transporter MgtE